MRWRDFLPPPLAVPLILGGAYTMVNGWTALAPNPGPRDAVPTFAAEGSRDAVSPFSLIEPLPPAALTVIWQRPLFSETRLPRAPDPELEAVNVATDAVVVSLPEPVPAEISADPQPAPPAIILRGSMKIGNEWQVLLERAEGGEERWHRRGERLDGWVLSGVSASAITLRMGEAEFAVTLFSNQVD